MYANSTFNFSLPTKFDMDGDGIACSATLSTGDPLPDWALFYSLTCMFSFMPAVANMGTYTFTATLTDNNANPLSQSYNF